jgi:hypothetical protein
LITAEPSWFYDDVDHLPGEKKSEVRREASAKLGGQLFGERDKVVPSSFPYQLLFL